MVQKIIVKVFLSIILVFSQTNALDSKEGALKPFLVHNGVEYLISSDKADADLAYNTCEEAGYKLLSLTDYDENDEIKKKLNDFETIEEVWTSGRLTNNKTSYIWYSISTPFQYTDFSPTKTARLIRNRRDLTKKCGGCTGETCNESPCENAPKCNITLLPCQTVVTKPCEIKCPNCTSIRPDGGCSSTCPPCTILEPPKCQVLPPNCTVKTDECITEQPQCEVTPGECTTIRPACITTQKACRKISKPIPCPNSPKCIINNGPLCTTNEPICTITQQPCVATTPQCNYDNGTLTCPPSKIECEPPITTCSQERTTCRPPIDCNSPVVCQSPAIVCQDPVTHCPPPVTHCPLPSVKCDEPKIKCPEPEVVCTEPEIKCTKPLVHCPGPEIACPGVVTHCTNVETNCPPPEVVCPDPLVKCEKPVPCISGTFEPVSDPTCPEETTTPGDTENVDVGCVGMRRDAGFMWDVQRCDKNRGFICERALGEIL